MRPKLYRHLLLRFIFFIHRKVAKRAEKSHFMFAVERTANIKDNSPQIKEKSISIIESKWATTPLPEGLVFFNFLASQQKVKTKIPLRSL